MKISDSVSDGDRKDEQASFILVGIVFLLGGVALLIDVPWIAADVERLIHNILH